MANNFLQSINFRSGIVIYNDFNINPQIPLSEQEIALKEDILQVEFGFYLIDIGWYPEFELDGRFVIKLVPGLDWQNLIHRIEAKSFQEVIEGLQEMIDYCENLKAQSNF